MRFVGLLAVNGGKVLSVPRNRVVSIVGPIVASKTTVFNCMTGSTGQPLAASASMVSRSRACPQYRLRLRGA
jgi:ABC-type branched-subunit amino acid transport system ATPase component